MAISEKIGTIFVVGSARSGSTLLYNILCSDRNVNKAINETHLLGGLCDLYRYSLSRLDIEQGNYFSNEEDARDFFGNYACLFLDKVRTRHSVTGHLVLKSIVLSAAAPTMLKLIPDAFFCFCIRDPRDIIASMIEVGVRQEALGMPNQYPRNVQALAQQVLRSYLPCLNEARGLLGARSLVVKYESLVGNVQESLAAISQATGLDLDDYDPEQGWPRNSIDVEARKQAGAPFLTQHWGKRITGASIGAYKAKLDAQEVAIIGATCKVLFDHFGYSMEN